MDGIPHGLPTVTSALLDQLDCDKANTPGPQSTAHAATPWKVQAQVRLPQWIAASSTEGTFSSKRDLVKDLVLNERLSPGL
jgi:hypothetical protein